MDICKQLRRGLMPFVIALALSIGSFMTEAKAATVGLGNVSSATGSLSLSGFTFIVPLPFNTDAYSFTLTDNAKVSGVFNFGPIPLWPTNIDLTQGATNLVHTTAYPGLFSFIPGKTGLFSLDLTPGTYLLAFTGAIGFFSGTLAFAPVAATPIPAALPLFGSALGALGFVGWRRKKHKPVQA